MRMGSIPDGLWCEVLASWTGAHGIARPVCRERMHKMIRVIPSTGCPTLDAELATFGDVVLRGNADELIVLRYSRRLRCWYACGCPSVHHAADSSNPDVPEIPEAEIYWKGIGYLEDAAFAYAVFLQKPVKAHRQWNRFYRNISEAQTLPPLRIDNTAPQRAQW